MSSTIRWTLKMKEKFREVGKEQVIKVDTPKTEEKTINVKPDAEKAEAPKKKKNIKGFLLKK